MEHRWGHRVAVDIAVQLRGARANALPGRLCNLSISGALIRTELVIAALAPVDVIIGSDRLPAHVTRVIPGFVAVEWLHMGPAGVTAVLQLAHGQIHAGPT